MRKTLLTVALFAGLAISANAQTINGCNPSIQSCVPPCPPPVLANSPLGVAYFYMQTLDISMFEYAQWNYLFDLLFFF